MRKCDYCGNEYHEYDLYPVLAYRRTRYMCYRCRAKGNNELKKIKIAGMEKKGLIGEK